MFFLNDLARECLAYLPCLFHRCHVSLSLAARHEWLKSQQILTVRKYPCGSHVDEIWMGRHLYNETLDGTVAPAFTHYKTKHKLDIIANRVTEFYYQIHPRKNTTYMQRRREMRCEVGVGYVMISEEYFDENEARHNDSEPALVKYDGSILIKNGQWVRHGVAHRYYVDSGSGQSPVQRIPDVLCYRGEILRNEYWQHGRQCNKKGQVMLRQRSNDVMLRP